MTTGLDFEALVELAYDETTDPVVRLDLEILYVTLETAPVEPEILVVQYLLVAACAVSVGIALIPNIPRPTPAIVSKLILYFIYSP